MADPFEVSEIEIKDGFLVSQKIIDQVPHISLINRLETKTRRESFTYIPSAQNNNGKADNGFQKQEYDFIEIGKAEDTDSYVYQSIFKRLSLAMAQGFSFVSRNREALTYIQERIAQLEVVQGQTFWTLVTEVLGCLFRYHNCFIIKSRDPDNSGGRTRSSDGQTVEPISELSVVSPEVMEIKIGKNNRPVGYKQLMPDGRHKLYLARDVIHVHINKKPHFISAAPSWQPVLNDVAALRRIEENIENLIYQHLYPLYHYKVGNKDAPAKRYENGYTEIDEVKVKLKYMPSDGMVVTPDRHEIKLISDGRVLRAEAYLEHFKNRVIAGSGMSQIDFGDGDTANRSTSDTMSKLAVNNVKFYQKVLADSINFSLIRELLLESTFGGDVLSADNIVKMQFAEIDLEMQIKTQNHYMLLYNGNVITRTHARNMSGWEALTEEEEGDLYLETVSMPEADKAQEGAMALAKSKQQPTNQHKTNAGPTKKKSSVQRDSRAQDLFNNLRLDVRDTSQRGFNLGQIRQLFFLTETQIVEVLQDKVRRAVISNLRDVVVTTAILDRMEGIAISMEDEVRDSVHKVFKDCLSETVAELMTGEKDNFTLDTVAYRIGFIDRTVTHKAAIRGQATALLLSGVNLVRVVSDADGDDHEEWHGVTLDLHQIPMDRLPPFHPNCNCSIQPLR